MRSQGLWTYLILISIMVKVLLWGRGQTCIKGKEVDRPPRLEIRERKVPCWEGESLKSARLPSMKETEVRKCGTPPIAVETSVLKPAARTAQSDLSHAYEPLEL